MRFHNLVALMAGVLLLQGSVTAQEKVGAPPANAVAATVNGQPIPEVAVQRALRAVPPEKHAEARPEILSFLIETTLLDQHLVAIKVNVDAKEVQGRLTEVRGLMEKQKLDYKKVLQDMMMTEEEFGNHVVAELRWEKFIEAQVSDKALRDLFDRNPDMFNGSSVKARHILLSPPAGNPQAVEQARQQLLAMRKQIEDTVGAGLAKLPPTADALAREKERVRLTEEIFAAVAKTKSECPSKEQGGDVGTFPRFGAMVEPFAKVAFASRPYQISDPVVTQFGVHLILVTDKKPGKPDLKFDEVRDDVKEVFAIRLREALCNDLKAKARISMK
jgi:peptidyl-prolyl cis-trans isomerase C